MNHRMATRVVIAGAMLAIAVGDLPARGGTRRRHAAVAGAVPARHGAGRHRAVLPTGVASFVADAALETQTAPGVWSVVTRALAAPAPAVASQACIDQGLTPCYRLNQRDCTPRTGHAAVPSLRRRLADVGAAKHGLRPTVSHTGEDDAAVLVLLLRRLLSYDYPPDDLHLAGARGRLGDGQRRRRDGRPPEMVGYSQHCTGERRAWGDTPRWQGSTHPVVDVGRRLARQPVRRR